MLFTVNTLIVLEQLHQLKERFRKATKTAQSHKTKSNGTYSVNNVFIAVLM